MLSYIISLCSKRKKVYKRKSVKKVEPALAPAPEPVPAPAPEPEKKPNGRPRIYPIGHIYKCEVCDYVANTNGNLKTHFKSKRHIENASAKTDSSQQNAE